MLLRELFEAPQSVGLIFGRFNPPHKGHKAAWEMASKNSAWYVGTNKSTQGPKDPLPYDVKIKAMQTIMPEVAKHIVAHQSWLTLAADIYKKHGDVELKVYTDEAWVLKALDKYNGAKGAHGMYNFPKITSVPTPRLSSATALRTAVANNDPKAFADAAGVPADTPVDGKPFFELVGEYLNQYKKENTVAREGKSIPNPKDSFLTKSDTAYDFIKLGTNMANLKSMPAGSNVDEPDIMVVPYGGKKEKDYLKKQLKRIGYKTQDADKPGDDAHVDETYRTVKKKVSEGYKLQLERDKELLVLNITDTATGKRTEVRGKPGYETNGYDPTDKLHQLLDKVGRSASVSDMMNGDVVTINPKHPKGASAKTATDTAFNEALDNPYPFNLSGPTDSQGFVATAQTPNGVLRMDFETTDYDNFGIDFAVGKSMGKTEAGDEFRVFATVVAMMNKWIGTVGIEHVESFDFGANKGEHASDGRAKLYTRFAKKLASQLGWKLEQSTTQDRSTAFFKLTNPKPVPRDDEYWDALEENFAKDSITAIKLIKKYHQTGDEQDAFAAIKHGWNFIKNPKIRSIIVNIVKKVSTEGGYPEWNDTVAYIKKNTGIDVSNVNENFADGKKKGKSRPGRVKKSGASCNGSVTDLRKRAKNSSGEKAKMYHWCANMKSGKKKK